MKKFLFSILISIMMVSCTTKLPTIDNFTVKPLVIEKGEKVYIHWDVKDAKNVSINGIGDSLMSTGNFELILNQSTNFVLKAINDDKIQQKQINVQVIEKIKEQPKTLPIVEKRNNSVTQYVSGVINGENVKKEDNPELIINLIDIKQFPNNVKLYCTVKDKYGNHIANLAPPYNMNTIDKWKKVAEIIEGKETVINSFSVEEIREDIAPAFSSSLVLDYSGSMDNDFHFVDNAVNKAVNYIRPDKDDYEVIQFDHRIIHSIQRTNKTQDISKLIPFTELQGWTAFYDASLLSIENLEKSNKEKVIILFTDGADNSSFAYANDVVRKALNIGAKVFIIGFYREYGGYLEFILQSIAEQTGGKAYFPHSLNELDNIFAEIYQIMKVYYIVSYSTEKSNQNVRIAKLEYEFTKLNLLLKTERKYYTTPENIPEIKIIDIAQFETNKSTLKQIDLDNIKKLAKFLKDFPEKQIEIVGHTDKVGSDKINNALSLRRAKSVSVILLKYGVKKSQILKIEGKGKQQPYYPEELNDYERQANRRVSIKII